MIVLPGVPEPKGEAVSLMERVHVLDKPPSGVSYARLAELSVNESTAQYIQEKEQGKIHIRDHFRRD